MKTELGKKIVKINSKEVDDLNTRLLELAKELKSLPAHLDSMNKINYASIMEEVKRNRKRHEELQGEINDLCRLESYLT